MRSINGVDTKTENFTKREERKQKQLSRERKNVFSDNVNLNCETKDSSYGISYEGEVDNKELNAVPPSDRATAAIASSVIQNLGMITKEDMSLVIDKSKIKREKQKAKKILQEVESVAVVKAIYFDERERNHLVKFGPKHIFKLVQTSIKRNMLLDMSVEERSHRRELAFRRVLKARSEPLKVKFVGTLLTTSIEFEAIDYTELIDWTTCKLSSPPIMESISTESISSFLLTKTLLKFEFLKFPCHAQAVERCVKLVTEFSRRVCGQENRDEFIRSTLLSRSKLPKLEQKSHSKVMKQIENVQSVNL
ncbi:hypothetical protein ILUMI_19891 [Ignelater luminosus]|uniref:Uncharacterized protein n=1 Tax=Ignelater luminosus TaxID=2038154 RepID=A0A8K0CLL2_IGNLU|nr:hypothetical protein ILUMI_19891 [Ignelater luminosus]